MCLLVFVNNNIVIEMALGIFFSFFLVIFCSSSLQWPSCDLHKKKKTEQTQMEHENAGGYVKKKRKK